MNSYRSLIKDKTTRLSNKLIILKMKKKYDFFFKECKSINSRIVYLGMLYSIKIFIFFKIKSQSDDASAVNIISSGFHGTWNDAFSQHCLLQQLYLDDNQLCPDGKSQRQLDCQHGWLLAWFRAVKNSNDKSRCWITWTKTLPYLWMHQNEWKFSRNFTTESTQEKFYFNCIRNNNSKCIATFWCGKTKNKIKNIIS